MFEVFLDADGVLYDFDSTAERLTGHHPKDPNFNKSEFWKCVSKRSVVDGPGFWSEMELFPGAHELVKLARQYNGSILTATGHTGRAMPEKAAAFHRDFGAIPTIFVGRSRDKARYAAANRILVDDRVESINPWVAAGGIGILHQSIESSILQLQQILNS